MGIMVYNGFSETHNNQKIIFFSKTVNSIKNFNSTKNMLFNVLYITVFFIP